MLNSSGKAPMKVQEWAKIGLSRVELAVGTEVLPFTTWPNGHAHEREGSCTETETLLSCPIANRWVAIGSLVLGTACQDNSPSGASGTQTTAAPAKTPVPDLTPPPIVSTTTSVARAPSNRDPSVRVTGDESCHPRRTGDAVSPCSVFFRAEASDPDGDSLSYRWSGCASGEAVDASCLIDQLHVVTATVEVTDGRGGRDRASQSAEGTNRAPSPGDFGCRYRPGQNPGAPDCGSDTCPPPIPTDGLGDCWNPTFDAFDEEGDRETCGPIVASGACHGPIGIYECGGVEDAFSFEFRTGAEDGECVLEISVADGWGATGSTTIRVPVRDGR